MIKNNKNLVSAFCTILFFILTMLSIVCFLNLFSPEIYKMPAERFTDFSSTELLTALDTNSISNEFKQIAQMGSRSPGQTGHKQCAKFIEQTYRESGLQVLIQEHDTAFPLCDNSEVLVDKIKTTVEIHPLPPNHLQPMITSQDGLTGKLVLISDNYINTANNFTNKIALIDYSKPLSIAAGDMINNYAVMGFKAVLISHSMGISELNWQNLNDMNMQIPVNYISAVADKQIFDYVDKNITIKLNTRFKNIASKNILGILSNNNKEAIVVPVSYDGFTMLPDLNNGSFNALQIAIQLQLLKGLQDYDKTTFKRDIIFVATAGDMNGRDSQNEILRTIGRIGEGKFRQTYFTDEKDKNSKTLHEIETINKSFENKKFCVDPIETKKILNSYSDEEKTFFTEQFKYVLRYYVFKKSEILVQAKAETKKQLILDLDSTEYKAFIHAKRQFDKINELSSYPINKLLHVTKKKNNPFIGFHNKLENRFKHLYSYHSNMNLRLTQNIEINKSLSVYDNLIIFAPAFATTDEETDIETISFSSGEDIEHGATAVAMKDILQNAIFDLNMENKVNLTFSGKKHGNIILSDIAKLPLHSEYWSELSYPAFSILSIGGNYDNYASPLNIDFSSQLKSIDKTLQIFGLSFLSMINGNGQFEKLKYSSLNDINGYVYASSVGNSVVPNFPLEGALITRKLNSQTDRIFQNDRGYSSINFFFTNPYGYYSKDMILSKFLTYSYSPEAALFDENGLIYFYKDEGQAAQRIYKSMLLKNKSKDVNIVLFRGEPVAILDKINPQTLKAYSDAVFISKKGLEEFPNKHRFNREEGILDFIKPDQRFFVELKSGSADNELVLNTRAFMLGIPSDFTGNDNKDIDGIGYLPMANKILYNIPKETAKSMSFINNKRIELQKEYGMIDEMTMTFHAKGIENRDKSNLKNLSYVDQNHAATQSVTYNTLNHPVIRNSISEAIIGVLWYMALLVPFAFFFEKLVFGFTDIRKQIFAQSTIFIIVFILLGLLHPAFQMIRSSSMILLGFIIMLISIGITLILSGKFKENIDALKKSQGHIKGATVNTSGILATAFMLGLNNMHRRKVRTGLTCATLVLLTFVMICFTSIQSDIVDTLTPIAKASYQGILIKEKFFKPISNGEVTALNKRYGENYSINARTMYLGKRSWRTKELLPPEITASIGSGDDARSCELSSGILFSQTEPLRNNIKLLTNRGWFTEEQKNVNNVIYPIIISDKTAEALSISPENVNTQDIVIELNSKKFIVHGVFESSSLENLVDFDGDNLLPFDITALVTPKIYNGYILAEKEDIKIPASDLFIGLNGKFNADVQVNARITSVAVEMKDVNFKEAKHEIDNYLEQSGKGTYYGLAGIAYFGRRARESSLIGLIDMLIPLLIAGLTVLNTMKGSVYERKDEIYVYNAVGIAPKYVFFMFIAEAVVYSVVGALLGYILSQGVGRILMYLGWTGGLNMNFTSIATVYASLTITAAVFLSTIYPARQAMKIAEPADEAGWKLPEPKDNKICFDLPFTYDHTERIAVMAFFYKYLINHGDGSSGPFFANKPVMGISQELDKLDNDGYIPKIEVTIWLKPFDLGVSQNMKIELATDEDTGEYISTITLTRLSGTLESWSRLNVRFVKKIRQHFLHWRAVSNEMKKELFYEAQSIIIKEVKSGEEVNG